MKSYLNENITIFISYQKIGVKMKKIYSIFIMLFLLLIFSFTSCSSSSKTYVDEKNNELPKVSNEIEKGLAEQLKNIEIEYYNSSFWYEYKGSYQEGYQYVYPTGKLNVKICNNNDNAVTISNWNKLEKICFKGACQELPLSIEIEFKEEDVQIIADDLINSLSSFSTFTIEDYNLILDSHECVDTSLSFTKELKTNLARLTNPTEKAYENAKYYWIYKNQKILLNKYDEKTGASLTTIRSRFLLGITNGLELCRKIYIGEKYSDSLQKCVEYDHIINLALLLKDYDKSICSSLDIPRCEESFEKTANEWIKEVEAYHNEIFKQAELDGEVI
jgi:hypothetical protein